MACRFQLHRGLLWWVGGGGTGRRQTAPLQRLSASPHDSELAGLDRRRLLNSVFHRTPSSRWSSEISVERLPCCDAKGVPKAPKVLEKSRLSGFRGVSPRIDRVALAVAWVIALPLPRIEPIGIERVGQGGASTRSPGMLHSCYTRPGKASTNQCSERLGAVSPRERHRASKPLQIQKC